MTDIILISRQVSAQFTFESCFPWTFCGSRFLFLTFFFLHFAVSVVTTLLLPNRPVASCGCPVPEVVCFWFSLCPQAGAFEENVLQERSSHENYLLLLQCTCFGVIDLIRFPRKVQRVLSQISSLYLNEIQNLRIYFFLRQQLQRFE